MVNWKYIAVIWADKTLYHGRVAEEILYPFVVNMRGTRRKTCGMVPKREYQTVTGVGIGELESPDLIPSAVSTKVCHLTA